MDATSLSQIVSFLVGSFTAIAFALGFCAMVRD